MGVCSVARVTDHKHETAELREAYQPEEPCKHNFTDQSFHRAQASRLFRTSTGSRNFTFCERFVCVSHRVSDSPPRNERFLRSARVGTGGTPPSHYHAHRVQAPGIDSPLFHPTLASIFKSRNNIRALQCKHERALRISSFDLSMRFTRVASVRAAQHTPAGWRPDARKSLFIEPMICRGRRRVGESRKREESDEVHKAAAAAAEGEGQTHLSAYFYFGGRWVCFDAPTDTVETAVR